MVVLVLRGLTGTAMAAGVLPPLQPLEAPHSHVQADAPAAAAGHQSPSGAQGAQAGSPEATEPEAGHDHDHASAPAGPTDAALCDGTTAGCTAHDHHAACSACEICHSAMLDAPAALTPAHLPPGALRPWASAQFDSAPAALAIKPPIA
ncbi:hypothetical protein DBV10_03775 [Acidovorax sp. FJL06]|nr:hypothetical protein DBV10_03775 [Acidovorax sp. FJL06]